MNGNKKKSSTKSSKNVISGLRLRGLIAGLVLMVTVLCEMYVMVNMPKNIMMMGVFAIVALNATYFMVTSMADISQIRNSQENEAFENILKSEKASYLLMRKSFAEMAEQLEKIHARMEDTAKKQTAMQKNVAKVTINREASHAETMQKSNEELVALVKQVLEQDKAVFEKVTQMQMSVMEGLRSTEYAIKDSVSQQALRGSYVQPQVVMPQPQVMAAPAADAPAPMPEIHEEPAADMSFEEEPVMEEAPVTEEPVIDEVPLMEETATQEDEPAVQEPVDQEISEEDAEPANREQDLYPDVDYSCRRDAARTYSAVARRQGRKRQVYRVAKCQDRRSCF